MTFDFPIGFTHYCRKLRAGRKPIAKRVTWNLAGQGETPRADARDVQTRRGWGEWSTETLNYYAVPTSARALRGGTSFVDLAQNGLRGHHGRCGPR